MAGHRLEKQGRFADAGVTSQQDDGTGHEAASKHPVPFPDSTEKTVFQVERNLRQQLRRTTRVQIHVTRWLFNRNFFLETVPALAIGAAPQPFGADMSALLTTEDGFLTSHGDLSSDHPLFDFSVMFG